VLATVETAFEDDRRALHFEDGAIGSDAGEVFPAYARHWMQDGVQTASGERAPLRRVGTPTPPRTRAHAYLRN
jgi:hypothetical protein